MSLINVVYCGVMISLFIIIFTSAFFEKHTKIVPAPTLPHVKRAALQLIPKIFLKDGQYKIFELGCGWGGILMALSKLFPNSKIIGYELSPWPYAFSRLRAFLSKKDVRILRENFFDKDISSADIIFCYLSPYHMERLKEKFDTLPHGKCIISCSFPILGWRIDAEDSVQSLFVKIPIYRYITGAQ